MTYKETLDWMFVQLPMYQEKGKAVFNAKLGNIKLLAAHLNNPENKIKTIHVAGTNGKGSSSHMLSSILQEAGYKVGLYTSPHLKDFRERIRINGIPVNQDFVVDFIAKHITFFKKHKMSFFEMSVGMALAYFESEAVDIAVIEVGLGGRLDATNIVKPEVALITNIGFDHVDLLGDSLEEIAGEKGGIIKENTPVVISEYQTKIAPIFKNIAEEKNALLLFAEKTVETKVKTDLLGEYQHKNIKGVLAVLRQLKHFEVNDKHIENGLTKVVQNTGLLGRWQVLQKSPKVVCDTAHNVEGLTLVLNQIQKQKYNQLHIVLGFVKDKNLSKILPLFPINAQYYFCKPNIPRGLEVEALKKEAVTHGLKGEEYLSVNQALISAKKMASKDDFIFIGGSNFVIAEIV